MTSEIPERRIMSLQAAAPARGSSLRTDARFGKYILGQTLGEGEFGKVKLGWTAMRNDSKGDAQVAIKLIRKESVGTSRSRLNKIEREIVVLQRVNHPNIVKCHEVIETERYIGIILEYASGGELFDYILAHRYLKDPTACKLFAQLISAVQYLHLSGIVHRDLKLENLLLDRNRNIVITDFGFANTFNVARPLNEAATTEACGLNKHGQIPADLMQTSCGSPCYAAPELVVGDGKYCGRKVDVWSCGVILYAMLAGYLPFDDDPANPEGDNISLLYKYIVNTPLTFPEYVTPLARDLLRRILVPNPEKRTCLEDIIAHSWLKSHARIVLTYQRRPEMNHSSDEATALASQDMIRSSSERTASHASRTLPIENRLALSGSCKNASRMLQDRTTGNSKRHTVQIEYEPPATQSVSVATAMKPIAVLEAKTLPTNCLSVAATPSMVRSASHSGSNYQSALSEPPPLIEQAATKANTRLPGPVGRPRPTSYHPSTRIITEIDHGSAVNVDTALDIESSKSDRTKRWSQASINNAKTASPRSTKQNASGELTTSGLVVKRVGLGDVPRADTLVTKVSTSPGRHHKRNSSSISTLFGRIWPTSTSRSNNITDIAPSARSGNVMDSIQETLPDDNVLITENVSKVLTSNLLEPAIVNDGTRHNQPGTAHSHWHQPPNLVANRINANSPQNEGKQAPISTRVKGGKTHERISSSAARRVMDFFTNRRKDRSISTAD
ncbi:protein of unknown function [Taphrina deformans PYCC 5710]|uniref:Protein kinase domain-containing protein n=1 Tax=Taphrina deformans (strain PYCC 5710 / ATCC 11124 / CBS 356.35 / IMI 108563 / JCM 9778 / NBRC 8474) TaxID=1097556 RepID=R4XEY4_TAPDE|nr:protein of unknown function [Taphrina deformans PYCC 5710]|eukprot:CCG84346.1 protein of unknown function [Taphrina deformans PYCC 5710]